MCIKPVRRRHFHHRHPVLCSRKGKGMPSPTPDPRPWHALDADEVVAALDSAHHGISAESARERLAQYGRNELPVAAPRHPLLRFLSQFNNALILFLLAAGIVAALLGHHVDAAVIAGVVVINALVGFIQEGRAEQAMAALRSMLAPTARVVRDHHRQEVDVAHLVPGDIVLLEAGDRVPADLRLLRARGMLIDEAVLTGESVAAQKHERPVAIDAALGDRSAMAHSGTLVAAGQGMGIVTTTGTRTEIGRISVLLGSVDTLTTPLLRQINRFGRSFTFVSIALSALLFAFAIMVRDYAWLDALMVVVALAVGVVPESLPAVVTITLAIGVQRMAKRHAIVRRLPAVETLGATTVICSDKTGTLTRNEMTVRRVVTAGAASTVSGAGYVPEGLLTPAASPATRRLIECGLLCNDAQLAQHDGHWRVDGDPMEGALIALAIKAGVDPVSTHLASPRRDEIPFDAQHRFMATLHDAADGGVMLCVKGAPERLLAMSRRQLGSGGAELTLDETHWQQAISDAASAGERVLGFAYRHLDQAPARFAPDTVEDLVFAGIAGFIDPPRDEALHAIADCRSAGISIKMITGDHATTASAIAQKLGLAEQPLVVTGQQLDRIDDAELPAVARRVDVFARTSPEHKLRVVRALQADCRDAAVLATHQMGPQVVAMTGDGVNDAPSLKQADVGIAMGRKGTEAAREASEMVLADDNFASIVAAVHEGRTVYDNIRKVIAWTLPTNGGEALAIVAALMFGLTLPMTPPQILWINMVLTVTLGLALAFEPPEAGVMRRPPRRPDAPLISPFMLWRIGFVSLLFTAGAFGIFTWAMQHGFDVETARTMVVNTICVMEVFYLFNVRYLHATSITSIGVRGTPAVLWSIVAVVLAQLAFTYAPWMQALFDTRAVPLAEGLLIIAIGVVMMVVLEAEKSLLRRFGLFDELRPHRRVPPPHTP
jgi:calcium-translocating P-type ATPase